LLPKPTIGPPQIAPPAESLPAPKIFFAKASFTQRATPLVGQNHFWTSFWERGHEQFSESKSPPTGGSHLPHAHQAGLRCGEPCQLISPEVAEPVG
jgi:hypothetical protein